MENEKSLGSEVIVVNLDNDQTWSLEKQRSQEALLEAEIYNVLTGK